MAFLRKWSIRSQLLLLAAFTVIVVLSIILYSYSVMTGMITRNHEQYVKQTVSEIHKNVTSNHDFINRLMQDIAYNEDVQSYLTDGRGNANIDMIRRLSRMLSRDKELKEGILDIVISGNQGAWLDINGGNFYVEPLKDALPAKASAYYVGMRPFGGLYSGRPQMIFATSIYYVKQGDLFNRNIGTLFFILNPKALAGEENYNLERTNTEIFLLDREGSIITSNTGLDPGSTLPDFASFGESGGNAMVDWNGETYVMEQDRLPDIDGTILSMAPKHELLRDLADTRREELILLGIGLLLLAIPFTFIINNILRPLNKMVFFMTNVKRGELPRIRKRLSLGGYLEINIMAAEFNSMLDETEQLTERLLDTNAKLYGTELAKRRSELAFLRSQINPHFLYNTLESITGMAVVEGQTKIKTMTRALSTIFRYSIKGADKVPLREEIRIVESYVSIQRIRFENRFETHYRVSDAAAAFPVPRMILQPLVENAVYHGFEPTMRPGKLTVGADVTEEGILAVWVEDDGVGMPPDRLEELRRQLDESASDLLDAPEKKSIGLVNVNNRIRMTFGSGSGLTIESVPGRSTRVVLTISERGDS
ncbi:sensor histidine kinase [Cohnella sp. REN36]|uniref:sensor histidine kinase n=1 Tax=Cohnella sp. REN36 TaxID=2887347 RepID=UPI001D154CA2|nr:sensor histidine kinase [Cohnella sp. REN36]MCC3375217.1 sensor histidine kinase [Cohnella sp. REN36]